MLRLTQLWAEHNTHLTSQEKVWRFQFNKELFLWQAVEQMGVEAVVRSRTWDEDGEAEDNNGGQGGSAIPEDEEINS